MRYLYNILVMAVLISISQAAWGEEPAKTAEVKFVGSFFDTRVSEENYYFIRSVLNIFGNKFGPQPKTAKEIDDVVWDQLVLSYEAFKRGIAVSQEDLESEIDKILGAENVAFDRKKDAPAYEAWLREKINEQPVLFENQLRHLIQLKKLREEVTNGINPDVSDAEAFQAFLNENSSLDVELVQFDSEKGANDFYNKVRKKPAEWDKEKEKRPKDFKRPGGVTVQFILDFWKIPEKAQHEMVIMKPGEFHKSEPIYKGWGAFKVLGGNRADDKAWPAAKERYAEKVKAGKRYEGYNEWFSNLKKEANIKIYEPLKNEEIPDQNGSTKKGG